MTELLIVGMRSVNTLSLLATTSNLTQLQQLAILIPYLSVSSSGDYTNISITNRIDLDASIRFLQKNLKTDPYFFADINAAHLNKINFIDINPNISYKLTNRISFSFGPFLSYAIDGKQKMMTNDGGDVMAGEIPYKNSWTSVNFEKPDYPQYESQVSRLDYGVDIGLSYLLTERIQLKTNYSLGFSDLNIAAENYGEQDYSQKTSVFYLTMGYILN